MTTFKSDFTQLFLKPKTNISRDMFLPEAKTDLWAKHRGLWTVLSVACLSVSFGLFRSKERVYKIYLCSCPRSDI